MKTFKIEIILDVDDYTTNIGWIVETIKEQLEEGECLVSAQFQDIGYNAPKFEPCEE
jgi:archaellum component FlaD/FlaE